MSDGMPASVIVEGTYILHSPYYILRKSSFIEALKSDCKMTSVADVGPGRPHETPPSALTALYHSRRQDSPAARCPHLCARSRRIPRLGNPIMILVHAIFADSSPRA